MAGEPNQGATGATPTGQAEAAASTGGAGEPGVNQGATGSRPMGESPLSAATESDPFAERPEAFVGAAFAGGFALAVLLKRLAR